MNQTCKLSGNPNSSVDSEKHVAAGVLLLTIKILMQSERAMGIDLIDWRLLSTRNPTPGQVVVSFNKTNSTNSTAKKIGKRSHK